MLVNDDVTEENQFKILKRFPYLRLYLDLSEKEKKLFSNSYVPKVFFEGNFLTKMMKYNYLEDSDLKGEVGKTTYYKQKFRKMFMDICQNRMDKIKKSGAIESLKCLCQLASSIYHIGNSFPHFLTKNDRSFTTVKSFFDKSENKLCYSPRCFFDILVNLKKSNLLHMNILGKKQKVLLFMYPFFCIDIFCRNKNTKFDNGLDEGLSVKFFRCSLLFFVLFSLICTIFAFSLFYVIMLLVCIGVKLWFTNVIVKSAAITKKVNEYNQFCLKFNEIAKNVTTGDMLYYRYKEYKQYTEICFNYTKNSRFNSSDVSLMEYKYEFQKLFNEEKKDISSIIEQYSNNINLTEMEMNSSKEKEINTDKSKLEDIFAGKENIFDKPIVDQGVNAAPTIDNGNDSYDLPNLEEILKVKENKQNESSSFNEEAPKCASYYYNINEIDEEV